MPTYLAATGIDAFLLSPTQPFMENGYQINTNYGKWFEGIAIDPATSLPAVGLKTMWTHFGSMSDLDSYTNGRPFVTWYDSTGKEIVRLNGGGSGAMYLSYLSGDAWVSLPVQYGITGSWLCDVRIDLHPTQGRLQFYCNQQYLGEWKGLKMAGTDIGKVRFSSQGDRYYAYFWNIILASYNTIGHTVRTRRPQSAGANSEWVGAASDINEAGLNDATSLNTIVTGAVSTFKGDILSPTTPGNVIKAITVAARIRNDGGEVPRNAKAVVRVGGVNFAAPENMQINAGFIGSTTTFDVNPATGKRWASVDEINGEFGLLAVE